jgi:hypothetical protein
MKRIFLALVFVAIAAVVVTNFAFAGDEKKSTLPPEIDAYMDQFMEAVKPGPHHEALAKRAGEWNAEIRSWVGGPEPVISHATCTYEVVLDGGFLLQRMEGEVLERPYSGIGLFGFDKVSGKHTTYWIDTMGTVGVYAEGECSNQCTMENYEFSQTDPLSGENSNVKTVTTIKSDDEHVFQWFVKTPNGDVKTMEIVYTRK